MLYKLPFSWKNSDKLLTFVFIDEKIKHIFLYASHSIESPTQLHIFQQKEIFLSVQSVSDKSHDDFALTLLSASIHISGSSNKASTTSKDFTRIFSFLIRDNNDDQDRNAILNIH